MFDMPGAWDKQPPPLNKKTGKPCRAIKESDWIVMDKKTKKKYIVERVLVVVDTFEIMSTNEMKLDYCYKHIYNRGVKKLSVACKTAMTDKRLVALKINLYDKIIGYANE